jgi:hypothetical protein
MPITSRAFVKASIIYLGLGAALGALLLVNRWLPLGAGVFALKASHVQFLVVGWLTQLILGVAWWLFPPLRLRPRNDLSQPMRRGQSQRGSEPLFWVTFACLNAGILFGALASPLYAWTQVSPFGSVSDLSNLLLLIAAVSFVANMWKRVRALGR